MSRKSATVLLFALFLGACAGNTAAHLEGPFVVTPATEAELREYLGEVFPTRRGAFAVSEDGANSHYAFCPEFSCMHSNYVAFALRQCRSLSGQSCRLLYVNSDPKLGYHVDAQRTEPGKHGSYQDVPIEIEWLPF